MARGKPRGPEDKWQAALAYCVTGSTIKAGKITGIPERTVREWTEKDWWADMVGEAKASKSEELDAMWTGVIHEAVTEATDRVIHGDFYVEKNTGELKRKPMSGREAALIAAIGYDKRALGRGEVTRRTENITTERKLDKIKKGLEKLGEQVDDIEEATTVH